MKRTSRLRPRARTRPVRSFRPQLDVLEDRLYPGDTLLGGLLAQSASGRRVPWPSPRRPK